MNIILIFHQHKVIQKLFYVKFEPNFSIDSDGVLFVVVVKFEGTVSASKGIIGGFTTDSSSFQITIIIFS